MKRFSIKLASNYANLCDHVIAPSQSLADMIIKRGVTVPVSVVPTGVNLDQFRQHRNQTLLNKLGLPESSFVVGHVGRLSKEKNLEFVANAVIDYLSYGNNKEMSSFLLVGDGPEKNIIKDLFRQQGMSGNLIMTGILEGDDLVNAYKSIDAFVFASRTETQGMVLIEAISAGVPVIAIDAPGARDIVIDYENGRLLDNPSIETFSSAISWVTELSAAKRKKLELLLANTAEDFSMHTCAQKALNLYESLGNAATSHRELDYDVWPLSIRTIESEFTQIKGLVDAASEAIFDK